MYKPLSVHTQTARGAGAVGPAPSQGFARPPGSPLRVIPAAPFPGNPANKPGKPQPPRLPLLPGSKLPKKRTSKIVRDDKAKKLPPRKINKPARRPRVASSAQIQKRLEPIIRRAFPQGTVQPRWGDTPVQTAARLAAQQANAAHEAYQTGKEVMNALDAIQQALKFPWVGSRTETIINPGLTYKGNWRHSSWSLTLPRTTRPEGWGSTITATDHIGAGVPQNNWLMAVGSTSAVLPAAYLDNQEYGDIPDGWFWHLEREGFWPRFQNTFQKRWYSWVNIYQNNTGAPAPQFVANQVPVPLLPLGQPLPQGMPKGMPMAAKAAKPARPLTRPRRFEEVAMEFKPLPPPGRGWRIEVYPSVPRKPGKAKETKSWGKASSAASIVFWLYENTQDFADWVSILVNAIPSAPNWVRGAGPTAQIAWLAKNPGLVATADYRAAAFAFGAWAIDEFIGAKIGEVNKRANRGISTGGFTIDMRTNAPLQYAPGGASSPGAFAVEFARAFF